MQSPYGDYQSEMEKAIYEFYTKLRSNRKENISLREAIVDWFVEGYAEEFREQYLKRLNIAIH